MLDNLLDIEVAYSLLKSGEGDLAKDPLDVNYAKLQTDLEVSQILLLSSQLCLRDTSIHGCVVNPGNRAINICIIWNS